MDKNSIKKYAVWARRELISRVSQKALQYGVSEKEIVDANADTLNGHLLTANEKRQRQSLISRIKQIGYQQTMEEAAYTWFNRFSAIRFMEVNGYLPTHVRVFTDEQNAFKPQILVEAIHLELDGLNMEKVYELKDANKTDELYKYLLITQCNALSSILPRMFTKIENYTALLFPDNLLREGSVIEQMISMIPEKDWDIKTLDENGQPQGQVQIIGWLYQYYNAEPKDKVFENLKKNIKISKEDIPAATQLFTPDWIVRYMVENSLGRLWVEGHPNDALKANWKYYLEEAEQEPEVQAQLAEIRKEYSALKPEEIKVIDPCMGSGHILVYMFDVLVQIYESYGYNAREAAGLILQNNLYGLDIDDRAAQLAYFAVMMKARQYDRRIFSRGIQPHVYAIVESNGITTAPLHDMGLELTEDEYGEAVKQTIRLIDEMNDAKEYGSILNITPCDWDLLRRFAVPRCVSEGQITLDIHGEQEAASRLQDIINVAEALAQKYYTVVTNPPYMGNKSMEKKLQDYIEKHYPNSEGDLSTVFMEATLNMCNAMGYTSMINIPVWMFSSSYTNLRKTLISRADLVNMLHLGRGIFGADFGTTSFVFESKKIVNYKGLYKRLYIKQSFVDTVEEKERMFFENKKSFAIADDAFSIMPNNTFAYWAAESYRNAFKTYHPLSHYSDVKKGTTTGDDAQFLRFWFEVPLEKISLLNDDNRQLKWHPFNKGGDFRRWYGNNNYVVNWEHDGFLIKNNRNDKGKLASRPQNIQYFYRPGITWTYISISTISFRYYPEGFAFAAAGPAVFPNEERNMMYLTGFLNSKVAQELINFIGGTGVTYETGEVSNIPLKDISDESLRFEIEQHVINNINLSKSDWDSFENSWDFKQHPLLYHALLTPQQVAIEVSQGFHPLNNLADAYRNWEQACNDRFNHLKTNEEEINRFFIDIYGLQDELTPDVDEKDVTVHKADLGRDIHSLISYAVGCMFGRYSLDCEGLAYAGGEWDASKYTTFPADKDNIIPICDDDYFDDDITGRFIKWIETVYGSQTLEENLKFIADALGGKGSPRDIIRNYFLNDFYADHLKIYQKRPIYWLFDSGKKNGFKALIYMHRYQPDTIARMRTDYVHEQQSRYRTAIADLEQRIASASTGDRVKLSKKLQALQDQASEIRVYEEKIHHLADQMIRIDLDDGVKVNYAKFEDVLAKIK